MCEARGATLSFLMAALLAGGALAESPVWSARDHWAPGRWARQARQEERAVSRIRADRLRHWHDLLASDPHRAGTPGDLAVARNIAKVFRDAGLEVEEQEIHVYLARPVSGEVEVVAPERIALSVREDALPEDPYSQRVDELSIGWNAYSGSGEATAGVVYANYGRLEDFAKLRELGVEVDGKIVIARYGGNFRGYKAKYAEEAGAVGLVIYTDPRDSGWERGLTYPEGGYANGSYIQRGSIITLPHWGDPLTPGEPATRRAKRLNPAELALPTIPVQPIGWDAAREILSRMSGEAVPSGWQGGLPFAYRLTGGPELRVRVRVKQEREVVRTVNVTGTLRGSRWPEQSVIVGSHHDAWGYGAGDPTAGTILVLEAARVLGPLAGTRHAPARSIVFAAWAAEEYGIIGSVEWVEAHARALSEGAVAYVNADMAAMGLRFRSSSAPALKPVMADVLASVRQPGDASRSVLEDWLARGQDETGLPRFGDLGGGSDHVGFYCRLGVPSASVGAGGSRGVSYHSSYDTLAWYRKVVGEDYASAAMLSEVTTRLLHRLADSDLPLLDPVRPAVDARRFLTALGERASKLGFEADLTRVELASRMYELRAREVRAELVAALAEGRLSGEALDRANALLVTLDREWIHDAGLPGRPWYRSLLAAPDETSGYAAWPLPLLRRAVEQRDAEALREAVDLHVEVFRRLERRMRELQRLASPGASG